MSEFSGKCDIYDILGDATDEYLQNSDFYIHTPDCRKHRIVINNQKDLAKYYPYIASALYGSAKRHVIILSSTSFIDREENEFINSTKEDLLRYYRKCKRIKKPYNAEEALNESIFSWGGNFAEWQIELAKRIEQNGEKVIIEGLHRTMQDYYRERWFEKMVELGYTEEEADLWIYGWNEKPRRKGYVDNKHKEAAMDESK